MQRKSISIKLADNNEYVFSERNREDVDISGMQDRLRKHKVDWIKENISDKDHQFALMMQQINRIYSLAEIVDFINSDPEEMKRVCYDSFKVENPGINLDAFRKLVGKDDVKRIVLVINELEETGIKKKNQEESQSVVN